MLMLLSSANAVPETMAASAAATVAALIFVSS